MSFKDVDTLLEDGGGDLPASAEVEKDTVVVVDDDESVRRGLDVLLRRRYRVILCTSAEEGVEAVDDDVCAVILDVKMKGHDGFWACNEIRKTFPDIPVLFYSAYQDLKDPFEIINEHHPFGYFTKDGRHEALLRALDAAVRMHRITLSNKALVRSLRQDRQQRA